MPLSTPLPILKGRGTPANPANRFEQITLEPDLEHLEHDPDARERRQHPQTLYLVDRTRRIITTNDSPDIDFTHSLNPYRGCSHGCVYCFARPTHEYLGFSPGLDFETRIMVKPDAPRLLREELAKPSWNPTALTMSGVTDCYQPVERKLQITRQCLAVLAEFRNPVAIVTKNHLVTRDIDLLTSMAQWNGCVVLMSVTSLDADVMRLMEPRTSAPHRRLDAIRMLRDAGVPVGVLVSPVVPGLTDHELPGILDAVAQAGAGFAHHIPLRLPGAVKDLFATWLDQHFPDRKEKILNRVRAIRGGRLNDPRWGSRFEGDGPWAEQFRAIFQLAKKRAGLERTHPTLATDQFIRPTGPQLTLF